ncbi:BTAD domain-containing putative transcriptional regulator [Paractinoplanes durhamensis]|uniref:BTAD domain-containing putative transcriptional regulator n=1 Tax=Paractinoplanes durhamensis TaxID=113563 RepID=UPI0019446A56|nr:BTAD domain-containing putative transcriptional regulator [Actinoplanes durhamensis]
MGAPLRFEILGEVRVLRDNVSLPLGPAKQQAVLAVLLLQAGRPVPTHQIVDAVWGDDPPENGANVVQKYVAGLRRVLDPDRAPRTPGELLALTGSGYLLRAEGRVDADDFQATITRAEAEQAAGQPAAASATLRGGLALWRGEALAGLTGPVFDSARTRLADTRATAWERWAEVELAQGRSAALIGELARLIEEFPLREGLRAQQMLALHQAGRQAEALAAYRDAREFFLDEVGAEPGERMRAAHLTILRNDGPASPAPAIPAPRPAPVIPPPPDPMPMPMYVPEPPRYLPPRRAFHTALEIVFALIAPFFTCGVAGWIYLTYAGIRRRNPWHVVAAGTYLALVVIGFFVFTFIDPFGTMATIDSDEMSTGDNIEMLYFVSLMVITAVHSVIVASKADGYYRRDQARQFAAFAPDRAREVGIGRPDLHMRLIDDGGLIDLNHVSGPELARVARLPAEVCLAIERDRQARGAFYRPEDLVARGLADQRTVRRLSSRLICLPPGPAPVAAPWPVPR